MTKKWMSRVVRSASTGKTISHKDQVVDSLKPVTIRPWSQSRNWNAPMLISQDVEQIS